MRCCSYGADAAGIVEETDMDQCRGEEQSQPIVQAADTATLERQNMQIIEQLTFLNRTNERLRQEMGVMKWKYEQMASG